MKLIHYFSTKDNTNITSFSIQNTNKINFPDIPGIPNKDFLKIPFPGFKSRNREFGNSRYPGNIKYPGKPKLFSKLISLFYLLVWIKDGFFTYCRHRTLKIQIYIDI